MAFGSYDAPTEATPREYTMHEWETEIFDKQSAHEQRMKQLDIEQQKLETKLNAWLRLPFVIITLPVRILFVIPLCIYVATGKEVPEQFWKLVS